MESGASRLVMAAALLAVLWIVVYWMTPTRHQAEESPPITFGDQPAALIDPALDDDTTGVIDPLAGIETDPEPVRIDPPEQTRVVIPPTFFSYTWKRGDDLSALAKKFWGDADLAMVISKSNPRQDMRRLRPGIVLRIPEDPHNIQGLDVDPVTGEPIAQALDIIDKGHVTEYVVEPNDTLTGIAYALYGKAALWTIIRDANLHQLKRKDGSDIRPGMRLVIPPPPDLSSAGSRSTRNRN